jgi:hypothetical protein
LYRDLGNDLIRREVDPGHEAGTSSPDADPRRSGTDSDPAGPAVPLVIDERDFGRDPRVASQGRDRSRLHGG